MAFDVPRFRLLPTVLLLTALGAGPLLAQDAGASPPGGRRGMGGAGMGQRPAFDPVVLEGPPAPEQVDSLLGLDGAQHDRYSTLYQNLMNSTKAERETVRARREAMRSGTGDRESMQQSRGAMRETMQTLSDRQKVFDEALKDFLSKDQLKKYGDWRDHRRKEVRDRFRQGGDPPA
jgi:hypothetical protein